MAEKNKDKGKIEKALIKKALGYSAEEIVEEYSLVDNEMVLSKRKRSTKDYPPDLTAIKLILGDSTEEDEYKDFTKEELEIEKERLLNLLGGIKDGD